MKSVAAFFVLLCLAHAQAWSESRRGLRQSSATAGVRISTEGETTAKASSQSVASADAEASDAVYSSLVRLFTTAYEEFKHAKGKHDTESFCGYARSFLYAEAEAAVTLQAEAYAGSVSCAYATGNADIVASGQASARARAEAFISLLVEAAVAANVGVNEATAAAVAQLEGDIFAEAFAAVYTIVVVDGAGSACSQACANASIAVDAVARIVIHLVAQVNCSGSSAFASVVSEVDTSSADSLVGGGTARATSGSAAADADARAYTSTGFD